MVSHYRFPVGCQLNFEFSHQWCVHLAICGICVRLRASFAHLHLFSFFFDFDFSF